MTSNSTETYDRGAKLAEYKKLLSLRAALFVSHRERRVTIVERTSDGWEERDVRAGETVAVRAPECAFAVDDLYAGIALEGV